MTQANDIHTTFKFLTESHLHILVNKYQCKVILMSPSQGQSQIVGTLFQPGYKFQKPLPRPEVKKLKEAERLVFIYVNFPPSHFEAFVPAKQARSRPGAVINLD